MHGVKRDPGEAGLTPQSGGIFSGDLMIPAGMSSITLQPLLEAIGLVDSTLDEADRSRAVAGDRTRQLQSSLEHISVDHLEGRLDVQLLERSDVIRVGP